MKGNSRSRPERSQPEAQAHAPADFVPARVPKAVVRRLSLYARALQRLEGTRADKVSSEELARMFGAKSAQVRKDLAYFGQFGTPGYGYNIAELRAHIKRILGADREFRVAVVGVGNLGSALLTYAGFSRQGYHVVCGFDVDIERVQARGKAPLPVFHMDDFEAKIREMQIDIVALAVPIEVVQVLADRCCRAHVAGILNFVPTHLKVPATVRVHYVDLALELESLGFYIR